MYCRHRWDKLAAQTQALGQALLDAGIVFCCTDACIMWKAHAVCQGMRCQLRHMHILLSFCVWLLWCWNSTCCSAPVGH